MILGIFIERDAAPEKRGDGDFIGGVEGDCLRSSRFSRFVR